MHTKNYATLVSGHSIPFYGKTVEEVKEEIDGS